MNSEIKRVRSYYYEFFAIPFFFYEDDKKFNLWKEQLKYLSQTPIQESDKDSFKVLDSFSFKDYKDEQNAVLFDFSYTNIPLSASFYIEGRDDGRAKELVVNTLKKSKFRRDSDKCKDSEDFLGFIFYMMSSLLKDEFDKNSILSTELFINVINEFIEEFIYLLKTHNKSIFFKHLGILLESFLALERSVLGAPKSELKDIARQSLSQKPYKTKLEDLNKKYDFFEDTDLI